MSVTRKEVERVTRLAALAVDDASLPVLTQQISRILEFVSQLEAVDAGEVRPQDASPQVAHWQALRPDIPRKAHLALPPARFAPAFRDGLFLVPRLGGLGSDQVEDDE